MRESVTLHDPQWNCTCEGCEQLRDTLRKHPEPWALNDTVVLDANGAPVNFRDFNVATVLVRHFNRFCEEF